MFTWWLQNTKESYAVDDNFPVLQDFASAGANMYTFHLEAVVEDAANAKHPDDKMTKVLKQVKDAGMYAGVALKPKTPIETLFPYIEDKLVDQVAYQTDVTVLHRGIRLGNVV